MTLGYDQRKMVEFKTSVVDLFMSTDKAKKGANLEFINLGHKNTSGKFSFFGWGDVYHKLLQMF